MACVCVCLHCIASSHISCHILPVTSVVFVEFDGGDENVSKSRSGVSVYVCGSSPDVVVGGDVFGIVSVDGGFAVVSSVVGGPAVVSSVVGGPAVVNSVVVGPAVVSSEIGLEGVADVSWGIVSVVVACA